MWSHIITYYVKNHISIGAPTPYLLPVQFSSCCLPPLLLYFLLTGRHSLTWGQSLFTHCTVYEVMFLLFSNGPKTKKSNIILLLMCVGEREKERQRTLIEKEKLFSLKKSQLFSSWSFSVKNTKSAAVIAVVVQLILS